MFEKFTEVIEKLANAGVPQKIIKTMRLGALTLNTKDTERGFRGVGTGDMCRQVVAKNVDKVALGSPTTVDSAIPTARAALDLGPDLVLIGHRIALLGGEADEDVKDKHGEDVGSHYAYVMQILSAMQKFVNREDLSQLREDSPEREIIQQFYGEIVKLYPLVARLELKGAAVQIESLIICLNERGVHHSQVRQCFHVQCCLVW